MSQTQVLQTLLADVKEVHHAALNDPRGIPQATIFATLSCIENLVEYLIQNGMPSRYVPETAQHLVIQYAKSEPQRAELIQICLDGIVPVKKWRNRDSAAAQEQLYRCMGLLAAGCHFSVDLDPESSKTLKVWMSWPGFGKFDHGGDDDDDSFYLPTRERLEETKGGDWY